MSQLDFNAAGESFDFSTAVPSRPGATPEESAKFQQLADQWRAKATFLSSDHEAAMLPEYQMIIGMGPAVLPLVLKELEQRGGGWFWALAAIACVNPVPEEFRGDIDKMTEAWLAWGRKKALI